MEEKILSFNGLQVNYKTAGTGPAILILHGWGRGSDSYITVQEQIALAGFQVVVPDLPGFGKTNPPQTVWGVDDYTDFVFQFARVLGLQTFVLLGHSFGGQVALKVAVLHPELVQSLILYGAAVIRRNPSLKTRIVRYIAKAGNMMFFVWPLSMIQGIARKALYRILGNKDERYSKGIMKQVREKILRQDLSAFLEKVKVPTFIIWGDKDVMTPVQDAYILKERIQDSFLEVIPNAGHRVHQEAPEQFVRHIVHFCYSKK